MKQKDAAVALGRILDALEADLLTAEPEEIAAMVTESGMTMAILLSDARMRPGLLALIGRSIGLEQEDEEEAADDLGAPAPIGRPPDHR